MELVLIGVALFLAFGNRANDNFKGFATVWGSATLSYRPALTLARLATVAGSLASLVLAGTPAEQFSGRGLVPDAIAGSPGFIVSVGLAAAMTVWIATRLGLPVSTTHALIGGLVGAGLGQAGNEVQLAKLAVLFLLPLLIMATLVLLASKLGLPVSTTHVSVGAIAGVGVGGRGIDWAVARAIALAWGATLPFAAAIAWLATLLEC